MDMFEQFYVLGFGYGVFEWCVYLLQESVYVYQVEIDRLFLDCGIDGMIYFFWCVLDEIFQNIVEEVENVFDKVWVVFLFQIFGCVE